MGYIENNAIAGVRRPGSYSLYIYFSNAHPLFYEILLLKCINYILSCFDLILSMTM